MIKHARKVLEEWQPGDYVLLMGDPALMGVVMTLVAEQDDVVNVLKWDRLLYQYLPERWDFSTRQSDIFEPAD
jgi:hypothetical protein